MAIRADRVGVRQDQVDVHGRVTSPSFLNELLDDLPEWTDMPVWVNGTEELLPSNNSVPVTSPILADIAYPDIRRDNQYFTYRESPTPVDGLAKIKSIKGNTLVWNQSVRSFESAHWEGGNASTSFSNGTVLCTCTTVGGFGVYRLANTNPANWQVGHVYFFSIEAKSNKAGRLRFPFNISGYDSTISETNTWVRYTYVATCPQNVPNTIVCFKLDDIEVGNTLEVRNPMKIDLTQMFGVGNEPATVEEFTSLFSLPYYAYNTGTLLSFNGTGLNTANEDESEEHTTTLPISTYFPTGMKSAGTVYDELTPTKAITRIGVVDLGSLTWTKGNTSSGHWRFTAPLSSMKKASSSSSIPNLLCVKYIAISPDGTWIGTKGITSNNGSTAMLMLGDEDYSDVSSLVPSLQGVYLYYELATPVELPTMSFE